MFTGIVEEVGTVAALERGARVARPGGGARATLEGTGVGGSIAVSGACLTIVERRADGFVFELGPETLARTALGRLAPGDRVNLERPLRFGGAPGGPPGLRPAGRGRGGGGGNPGGGNTGEKGGRGGASRGGAGPWSGS